MSSLRPPILLKARVRHTWWAAIPLALVLLVTQPVWATGGWVRECGEWLGFAALVLCVLGRCWCAAYIAGRKTQALVTEGPYSVVRNPLYLFSFCGLVGIGLMAGILTLTAVAIVLFAVYYREVALREEAVLADRFGDRYTAYHSRVPGWIPDFRQWRDVPSITVAPNRFLYTIRDSAWFFAAVPGLEALEWLQEMGALPVVLRLP